jgi:four helix bundle protein
MQNKNSNPVVNKSVEFAVRVLAYCDTLQSMRKFVVANQLAKSGTSIGANIKEAQNAESLSDFIHKMKIASKEAEETEYWLLLCHRSLNYPDTVELSELLHEIIKLLSKILITSINKKNNTK